MQLDALLAQTSPIKITPMHPALDVVGDVLYLTVHLPLSTGLQPVVLTSDGDCIAMQEWDEAYRERGLLPVTTAQVERAGLRWDPHDVVSTLSTLRTERLSHMSAGAIGRADSRSPLGLAIPTASPPSRGGGQHSAAASATDPRCPALCQGGDAQDWAETYTAIVAALDARLQVRSPGYLMVLALFAMMTYVHPLFDFLPILHLYGPPASGKSRAGHALAAIAFNGVCLGSPTPALLFRAAHDGRYTQILTEADHLERLGSGDAFVRQLQSACSKAEATVDLVEKRGAAGRSNSSAQFEGRTFYAFCPRVLVSTRPLASAPLRSRCIRLDFQPSFLPDHAKLRASLTDDAVWAPLRARLYRLALTRWRDVGAARERLVRQWAGPDAPSGRRFDVWLPLATVASLISEEVFAELARLATMCGEEVTIPCQSSRAPDTRAAPLLIRFMAWLVRDTAQAEVLLTAQEIDALLVGRRSDGRRDTSEHVDADDLGGTDEEQPPAWTVAMGQPLAARRIRQAIPGWRALLGQLKRFDLLPPVERGRDHNRYRFRRQAVTVRLEALIGAEAVHVLMAPPAALATMAA